MLTISTYTISKSFLGPRYRRNPCQISVWDSNPRQPFTDAWIDPFVDSSGRTCLQYILYLVSVPDHCFILVTYVCIFCFDTKNYHYYCVHWRRKAFPQRGNDSSPPQITTHNFLDKAIYEDDENVTVQVAWGCLGVRGIAAVRAEGRKAVENS